MGSVLTMADKDDPNSYNMWTIPYRLWDSPLAKLDQSKMSTEPVEINDERWAQIEERLAKYKRQVPPGRLD